MTVICIIDSQAILIVKDREEMEKYEKRCVSRKGFPGVVIQLNSDLSQVVRTLLISRKLGCVLILYYVVYIKAAILSHLWLFILNSHFVTNIFFNMLGTETL